MNRHGIRSRLMFAGLAGLVLFAPDGDPAGDPPPADPPADPDGDPAGGEPEGKFMTQAEIDRLVERAKTQGKISGETAVRKWLENEAASAEEQARNAAAEAQRERDEARREALTARAEITFEKALLAAKVPADRVDAALRLADLNLDDIAPDGKLDKDAIKALATSTVEANAFLLAGGEQKPPTTGLGAEHSGSGDANKVWTRAEVAKLTPDEYEKHAEQIEAQMRAGTLK